MKTVKFLENKIVLTDEQGDKQSFVLTNNPHFELNRVFVKHERQYYQLK